MESPLISVLMTSYNREKYIGEAIESVLASTYINFELIIVDDVSTDRTVEVARQYANNDARISIYINEKNLGDYPNRNKAASYAVGKYLKYVDADDLIYPWGLELLVNMMEQFPQSGWGLCSLLQIPQKKYPFMLTPKEAYEHNYFRSTIFNKAPLSSIIKKTAFDEIKGFTEIRMAGDFDMWQKLAQKYNVVLMPDGIVWYREHEEQESKDHRQFIATFENIKIKYLLDPHCPLDKETIKKIFMALKKRFKKEIFIGILKLNKNVVMDNFKALKTYKLVSAKIR